MNYLILIIFGFLPSILWLLFFLRKDVHPEPKGMVIRIFFWGMLITLPAIFIEKGAFAVLGEMNLPEIFYIFLGIAGVEEVLKYLVVKDKVLRNPEFDEPLDVMLYMIIAALGFVAVENILVLFGSPFRFSEMFSISILRFVGATFLHALCSGSWGYFLALSFFERKKQIKLFTQGILTAVISHGLFNLSIKEMEKSLMITEESKIIITTPWLFWGSIFLMAFILCSLTIFVSLGFKHLKKIKSVCFPETVTSQRSEVSEKYNKRRELDTRKAQ